MSLDHFHSSLSDLGDGSWDVHHLLFVYLLQDVVDHNKCTCATHTSTAQVVQKQIVYHMLHMISIPMYLTCSVLPWVPWRGGAEPSLSCGRLRWAWHSLVLHDQARQ